MAIHSPVAKFVKNAAGADWIVGDVHGCFHHLRHALEQVGFDTAADRLFAVGDLIDRGPHSAAAIDWLAQPWMRSVLGNHEDLLIQGNEDERYLVTWMQNGGAWWYDVDPATQQRFRQRLRQLPYTIEVDTDTGPVGIVHADLPAGIDWDTCIDRLRRNARTQNTVVWSRHHIRSRTDVPVTGERIRHVYCGHTPTRAPVTRGNVTWIDTCAFNGGPLTLVRIQPGPDEAFRVPAPPDTASPAPPA